MNDSIARIITYVKAHAGLSQLTGDITAGPGSGSQAATIANDAVTYAKMQNISAALRVLGRGSAAGSGDTQELTLGTNLTMNGTAIDAASGYTQGCRVYNTAELTVTTGTWTRSTFNTERYDTDTMHSTSSNTGRITFTTAGKYIVLGNCRWTIPISAAGARLTFISLNGTPGAGGTLLGGWEDYPAIVGNALSHIVGVIYEFAATDYVELFHYTNSGSNDTIGADGNYTPEFMAQRIG
jgi:hypothetical protein